MLVAFSVSPTTTDAPDGSVSEAVARAVRVVRDSGLPYETTSMFTTVEGEWDECMAVVKAACEAVAEVSPRVALVLKADIRPGWTGQMTAKVERVETACGGAKAPTAVPAEAEFCAGSLQMHVSRAGGLEGSDLAVPSAFHPCPGRTNWPNTPRISRLARRSSGGLAALHR